MNDRPGHRPIARDKEYVFDGNRNFIRPGNALTFSFAAGRLYYWMDGKTSDEALVRRYNKNYEPSLTRAGLQRFIADLNRNHLLLGRVNGCLAGQASPYYRKLKLEQFDSGSVREPVYAGMCYERDPDKLRAQLKACFDTVNVRRLTALCKGLVRMRGVLVPHSNMDLSGSCAAWAYAAISRIPAPDLFILLCPDHFGSISNYSVVVKDYLTPLGTAKVDADFAERLAAHCDFDIFRERLAHVTEHSLEMQIPFLQHIYDDRKEKPRILPVLCPIFLPVSAQTSFVRALTKTCRETHRRVFVIASTDLVHTGWKNYRYLHAMNKTLLHHIRRGDPRAFNRNVSLRKYAFCSATPVSTLLKISAPCRGRVLSYAWTSKAEVFGRRRECMKYDQNTDIGYASVAFFQGVHP